MRRQGLPRLGSLAQKRRRRQNGEATPRGGLRGVQMLRRGRGKSAGRHENFSCAIGFRSVVWAGRFHGLGSKGACGPAIARSSWAAAGWVAVVVTVEGEVLKVLRCWGMGCQLCERRQTWERRQNEAVDRRHERRLPKGGRPGGWRWQSRRAAPASGRWPSRRPAARWCAPFST